MPRTQRQEEERVYGAEEWRRHPGLEDHAGEKRQQSEPVEQRSRMDEPDGKRREDQRDRGEPREGTPAALPGQQQEGREEELGPEELEPEERTRERVATGAERDECCGEDREREEGIAPRRQALEHGRERER